MTDVKEGTWLRSLPRLRIKMPFTCCVSTPAQKRTPLGALPGVWRGLNWDNGFSLCAKYSGCCPVTESLGKKWNLGLERPKDTASEIDKQPGPRLAPGPGPGAAEGAQARAGHYRPRVRGTRNAQHSSNTITWLRLLCKMLGVATLAHLAFRPPSRNQTSGRPIPSSFAAQHRPPFPHPAAARGIFFF